MNQPPITIFYAETGGKTSPFYMTLGGIKSALKTSWTGRYRAQALARGETTLPGYLDLPKVFRGTVTWEEIDVETGLLLLPSYSVLELGRHLAIYHPNLVTSHDRDADHDRHHAQDLDHVHAKEPRC